MKPVLLYVCKCGACRVCGEWIFQKIPLSHFIRNAIKKGVSEIDFEIITCDKCLKNEGKNHLIGAFGN